MSEPIVIALIGIAGAVVGSVATMAGSVVLHCLFSCSTELRSLFGRSNLARDALVALGSSEPLEEAVALVAMTKWRGKLDRIAQRFSLTLGHKRYVAAYQAIDMQFLGKATTDPVEFLQATADLRHRLVHSAGRADAQLLAEYPQSGLTDGALIELPVGLPVAMHFWFVPLTDLLDEALSARFGWTRETTSLDQLIDADLRIA